MKPNGNASTNASNLDLHWFRWFGFAEGGVWLDGERLMMAPAVNKRSTLRYYQPLENEPELFLRYSSLRDAAGVLDFARRYGCLLNNSFRPETVRGWLADASQMRHVMNLWFLSQDGSEELRAWIRWIGPDVWVCKTEKRYPPLMEPEHLAEWFGPSKIYPRACKQQGWDADDMVVPAKRFVSDIVNENLFGRISPKLLCGRDGDVTIYETPSDLRSALWFQVLQMIGGVKKIRLCEHCRQPLDVTRSRSHKRVHNSCSRTIRMRRHRAKQKS